MNSKNYLFTSESVSEGHPDKVCDRISDMVVDSYLSKDPFSRVACETLTTTNKVVLAGETRGPEIKKNELIRIEAKFEPLEAELTPHKNMDIGAGRGETIKTKIFGGVVGLIFDGRERPITLPSNKEKRLSLLLI